MSSGRKERCSYWRFHEGIYEEDAILRLLMEGWAEILREGRVVKVNLCLMQPVAVQVSLVRDI
jgi:hypothetical protein